jgi:uncharacterized RDD family membrane protein YckC
MKTAHQAFAADGRAPDCLRIVTPEGVSFGLPLAGPAARFLAWLLDALMIMAMGGFLSQALGFLVGIDKDLAIALNAVLFFFFSIFYGILAEWFWRGQTVGKRLLKLRVVDAGGLRLRFGQVALRNLLRAVDVLPLAYLVGGTACLLTRHCQRLGDLAADTIVIRRIVHPDPDWDQLGGGKFNSLRDYPHLAARLRNRVAPAEAGLALQALVRREEMLPDARIELFEDLAAHFKSLVAFPAEAVEGLAAEQYVRNVVDLIFRTKPAASELRRQIG